MTGYSRALMEINAQALQHNLTIIRQHAFPARVLAILKANAYGHGLVNVAHVLQKTADGFGVACLNEAIALRKAGITKKIVVLQGAFAKEAYGIASQYQLDMVIHHINQYKWLLEYSMLEPITIWIKINTGMNRLGLSIQTAQTLIQKLQSLPYITSTILISHLASADQLDNAMTARQLNVFNDCIKSAQHSDLLASLANSAGTLAWPETHYDWVRPGLALYGVSPFTHHDASHYDLHPVMTLKAKIIAIQQLRVGDLIGYYGRFVCQNPMRIAIVAFGYGDGYPYNAPQGTPVLLHQTKVSIVGQVSMDMLTIDITTQPATQVGDEVTLWGEGLCLEEIARYTQRSCYEILCGVQPSTELRLHTKII